MRLCYSCSQIIVAPLPTYMPPFPHLPCARFDDVFGEYVDNDQLYCTAIRPLIATVFK